MLQRRNEKRKSLPAGGGGGGGGEGGEGGGSSGISPKEKKDLAFR